jgi:hypothetical protein
LRFRNVFYFFNSIFNSLAVHFSAPLAQLIQGPVTKAEGAFSSRQRRWTSHTLSRNRDNASKSALEWDCHPLGGTGGPWMILPGLTASRNALSTARVKLRLVSSGGASRIAAFQSLVASELATV